MIDPAAQVHPSADVEADVSIGPGTRVWHRSQIRSGARLGREVTIGRDVFVDSDVVVGDRCKVQNGAQLFHGLTVEAGVFIGPGAILTNDRNPRAVLPSGEVASAADWTVSPIVLREGSSIGAGAIVIAGVEVGRHALVGAGAVVTKDVEAFELVAGNPARRLGWVCRCGHRLEEKGDGLRCGTCGRAYVSTAGGSRVEELERQPEEAVR